MAKQSIWERLDLTDPSGTCTSRQYALGRARITHMPRRTVEALAGQLLDDLGWTVTLPNDLDAARLVTGILYTYAYDTNHDPDGRYLKSLRRYHAILCRCRPGTRIETIRNALIQ